ncbi:MAG TPA: methyltransferase domain-containing protein [Bryobacteraceae bacterium]|nr:methyltransferase domain-containing protein [Bryobacteraceae bacterium]
MGKSWNDRYAAGEASERPPEPLLIEAVRDRHPGRGLDLACGLGRNSLYLSAQGWDMVGVDYSRVALDILSERAAEGLPVHPVFADLEAGDFIIDPCDWDLIVDCCYLQRSLFAAIRDGIRPGGLFVGVFPMSGINPAYLMRSGEGRELFGDWQLLHYVEAERTEIVAEKV